MSSNCYVTGIPLMFPNFSATEIFVSSVILSLEKNVAILSHYYNPVI